MSVLVWDKTGEHFYETGVDHGVLYLYEEASGGQAAGFKNGVAWNGLTAVNESPSGAEPTALWADNIKYLNLISAEEYAATIEAYTYPDEFEECDGSKALGTGVYVGQQPRRLFGLCYRTLTGSDTVPAGTGAKNYKLHLIYNCTASPSERAHGTVNDSPEAASLSWSVSTTPVEVPNMKPTASITIDASKINAAALSQIEGILFGTSETEPRLPYPTELAEILGNETLGAVELNKHVLNLKVGDSATLTATTSPADAEVTWSSGSTSIADITDGAVSAEGAGNTIITASVTVGGVTYTDTCTVIVTAAA